MAAYAPRRYSDPKYVGFAVLQSRQQAAHPHATCYATAAYITHSDIDRVASTG